MFIPSNNQTPDIKNDTSTPYHANPILHSNPIPTLEPNDPLQTHANCVLLLRLPLTKLFYINFCVRHITKNILIKKYMIFLNIYVIFNLNKINL